MNKKLIFLVINFLYMVTATAQPLLIPYPRSIEMREGYFALTAKTGIINLSDKNNARLLKHYIEEDININLHEQRGDNNIFLITNRKLKESLVTGVQTCALPILKMPAFFTESKRYGS